MYAILAFATLTEVSTLAHRIWLIIFILLRLDIISGLRGIVYQFLGKQKSCLFRNNSSIIAYYFYFVKPISASHLRQYCTDCLDYSTPHYILSRVFTFWFWIRKVRLRVGGGLRKCARYGFSPLGTGYIVVSVRVFICLKRQIRSARRHLTTWHSVPPSGFYGVLAEFFVGVISNPINTHICVVCNVIIAHPLVFCQGFFRFSFSVMIIACETKNGWKIDLNIFIANILPILRHPIRLKSNGAGARGGNLGVSKKSSRPPAGKLPIILKVILPRSLSSTACLKMKKFLFLSLTL